jgi:Skp family chaperone for outer membrane proteins
MSYNGRDWSKNHLDSERQSHDNNNNMQMVVRSNSNHMQSSPPPPPPPPPPTLEEQQTRGVIESATTVLAIWTRQQVDKVPVLRAELASTKNELVLARNRIVAAEADVKQLTEERDALRTSMHQYYILTQMAAEREKNNVPLDRFVSLQVEFAIANDQLRQCKENIEYLNRRVKQILADGSKQFEREAQKWQAKLDAKDAELEERDVQRNLLAAQFREVCAERGSLSLRLLQSNPEREREKTQLEEREQSLKQREADLTLRESKLQDVFDTDIFFDVDDDNAKKDLVNTNVVEDDIEIESLHSEDSQQHQTTTTTMPAASTSVVNREKPRSSFKKRKHYVEYGDDDDDDDDDDDHDDDDDDDDDDEDDSSSSSALNKVSSKVHTTEILFSKRVCKKPELFSTQSFAPGRSRRSKKTAPVVNKQQNQYSLSMSRVKRVADDKDESSES